MWCSRYSRRASGSRAQATTTAPNPNPHHKPSPNPNPNHNPKLRRLLPPPTLTLTLALTLALTLSSGDYYRPFHLFGYDFLVDASLRIWLCADVGRYREMYSQPAHLAVRRSREI